MKWENGSQSGYLNFTRQWAYHWSVDNTDMNSVSDNQYECYAHSGYVPCGEDMTKDSWNNKWSYQPFKPGPEQEWTGWGTFCPGKVKLGTPIGKNPYDHPHYYDSYAGRVIRLIGDLQNVGAVVQIDLFEHSMPMLGGIDWRKNPYNGLNQVDLPHNDVDCTNGFSGDNINKADFCSINPAHETLYIQQEYFIGKIVGFCATHGFNNVFFDLINEGHYYNGTTPLWYDRMANKVSQTNSAAPISINIFPIGTYPGGYPSERAWYQEALSFLWNGMTKKGLIDIISYHYPFWKGDENNNNYISELIGWHYQNIGFGRVAIIDDDGGWGARDNNNDVSKWAYQAAHINGQYFIHKDIQCWCINTSTGMQEFVEDEQAKTYIATTPVN